MFFNIEEELKKLPSCPGVYIMHDENDRIIYVGKAISLRNRVRQYFQKSTKNTNLPRINMALYFLSIITHFKLLTRVMSTKF